MKLFLVSSMILLGAACSYHEYNPENETTYLHYWCNPDNRKNSIWSVFEEHNPFGTDNSPFETDSTRECLLSNGQIEQKSDPRQQRMFALDEPQEKLTTKLLISATNLQTVAREGQ